MNCVEKLLFEKSVPGRRTFRFAKETPAGEDSIPEELRRKSPPALPEMSEVEVIRHFTHLSHMNFSVDGNFYPLGSCTMKYNPRFTEEVARLKGFTALHPFLAEMEEGHTHIQGALRVLHGLERALCSITGMDAFTLQPMAGANGELTGVKIMAAYHRKKGNDKKKYILVPDSAHGTNPASATIAGFEVVSLPTTGKGFLEPETLARAVDDETAGLMLTCPNTLGIFNPHVDELCRIVHEVDGLVYYDGANLNAILGKMRPGDAGFDVVHLNLHKTFGTPHGGGGPGAGPVGVKDHLAGFLPVPVIRKDGGKYTLDFDLPDSIGKIAPFFGNFLVMVKAYAYIRALGAEGLERAAEMAVLNANYLLKKISSLYEVPYEKGCLHEFVASASKLRREHGISALDVAKALIDAGFHPPTVYFPLIVKEALMIEPTETESKETLDAFVEAMAAVKEEAERDPAALHARPKTTPVGRLDEAKAARQPDVAWTPRE